MKRVPLNAKQPTLKQLQNIAYNLREKRGIEYSSAKVEVNAFTDGSLETRFGLYTESLNHHIFKDWQALLTYYHSLMVGAK